MCEQSGPTELVDSAVRAERAGFDFAVCSDHFSPWLEAQGHSPYAWAVLYLGLGEKNRAIDELEKAYQHSDTNYLFVLKVDPFFNDLRGQPRFEALVQKVVGAK